MQVTMDMNTVLDIIRRLTDIQNELPRLRDIQSHLDIVRHAIMVQERLLIAGLTVIVGLQTYMLILSRRVYRAQRVVTESLDSLRVETAVYMGRVERLETLTGHAYNEED